MRHTFLILLLSITHFVFAQSYSVSGIIKDKTLNETLPFANVLIEGNGINKGVASDLDGNYKIDGLTSGEYKISSSFIGYKTEIKTISISNASVTVNFNLEEEGEILSEIEVVSDIAVDRETPVAFSAIKAQQIEEGLGGRDLPMILNETPGVYATETGGGSGDSEISIRGFSQSNVAVLVNGVPVNDMENGNVFWSNWDLGDVTKNVQVQRGLGASKLAVPSVGGTISYYTKDFSAKKGGRLRQEIGNNGARKTSFMLSSGKLKNDWGITVYGARKVGNGWVDNTWVDAWSYFFTISKRFKKHTLSLTGLGSPQRHGQRTTAQKISTYDNNYALDLGASEGMLQKERGYRFNEDWGYYNGNGEKERISARENYYHKPQITLNHFWDVNEKLYVSNVLYGSSGNGGGIGISGKYNFTNDGTIDFDEVYSRNQISGTSETFLRSSVNSHNWYGFITNIDYKLSERSKLAFGIDGRSYRGFHYQQITNLLGGNKIFNSSNLNRNPNTELTEGDIINYNYDGLTRWAGAFAQWEYKTKILSSFFSVSGAQSYYKRIDFFKKMNLEINGKTYTESLGYGDKAYSDGSTTFFLFGNSSSITAPKKGYDEIKNRVVQNGNQYTLVYDYYYKDQSGNTLSTPDTSVTIATVTNPNTYTIDSEEAKNVESSWRNFPSFTVKGGANYNINERNNIFFNTGFISRAPFFGNVFDRNGNLFPKVYNEKVFSFEMGYGVRDNGFAANINAYYTKWMDKSVSFTNFDDDLGELVFYSIQGMNALHYGAELDIASKITDKIEINTAISIGDWRWNSVGEAFPVTESGKQLERVEFNAQGVHVGGSAQSQFMAGLRYEPIKNGFIRFSFLYFSKNYSSFDPTLLSDNVEEGRNATDVYRLPSWGQVDLHAGYNFKIVNNVRCKLNASIINLLDQYSITTVRASPFTNPYDVNEIEVFFNQGRRYNLGLTIDF